MNPSDFDKLGELTHMLPGHVHRLQAHIRDAMRMQRASLQSSTAATASATAAPVAGPAKGTPVVGPEGAQFCIPCGPAAPATNESNTATAAGWALKNTYMTWPEAKLASKRLNTRMGCSVVLDRAKSGGKTKVYRCRCVSSKRKLADVEDGTGPRPKCPHVMWWTKKKSGWHLNEEKSFLKHMPMCFSGQHVSRMELVNDTGFVKHVMVDNKCTGASAQTTAVGSGGRLAGSVSEITARRARNDINHFTDKDYAEDWSKLKSWGVDFMQLNPQSIVHIEPDSEGRYVGHEVHACEVHACEVCGPVRCVGPHISIACTMMLGPQLHVSVGPRFKRMFVSVAACLHTAFGVGIRFSALDASFSKHAIYTDGCLHVLTTRDSDNRVLPLAWAVCETESGDTYKWFADWCNKAGLSRYLTAKSVLFTDRMKGIKQFFAKFNAYEAHCFKHIIENCKKYTKDCGRKFEDKLAWAMRNADTKPEYLRLLALLRAQSPAAAQYFNDLPHERVFQYAFNAKKVATHNFKTSQIVECLNGVFVNARHHTPYRLNNMILTWIGKEFFVRAQRIKNWISDRKHHLTPWCHKLFQVQVRAYGPNLA